MRAAFTLIELLVVITIIAILASLLLPSISRSKSKARATSCMNNLKNLTLAMTSYIDDQDSFFPYTRKVNNHDIISWDDLISGYDGRPAVSNPIQSRTGSFGRQRKRRDARYTVATRTASLHRAIRSDAPIPPANSRKTII